MYKATFIGFLMVTIFTAKAQDERLFQSLDKKILMNRLFDGVSFNPSNEAIWKPNYYERMNMPVSDDNLCHTVFDTIMYFDNGKQALIVFTTYQYENGERVNCHACTPTIGLASFIKRGDNWEIAQFDKCFGAFGSNGERGQFKVEKLGDDFYCLNLHWNIDGGQGYFSGTSEYYSLNSYSQFEKVFSYVYYDSNVGAAEDDSGYTEETTISIKPTTQHYSIELTSKRTDSNSIIKKVFEYSNVEQEYVLAGTKQ